MKKMTRCGATAAGTAPDGGATADGLRGRGEKAIEGRPNDGPRRHSATAEGQTDRSRTSPRCNRLRGRCSMAVPPPSLKITTRGVTRAAVGSLLVAALLLIGCENAVKSGAPEKVRDPSPRHNATGVSQDTDLEWAEVSDATGYRVYFGTDSTPDGGEFKRDQKGTTFDPGTLEHSTTYYWRVDSENDAGKTTGNVWKFKTAGSNKPTAPKPAHEATGVALNTNLEWAAAAGATSYQVYFGTDPSPDNSELIIDPVDDTTFEPGTLEYNTIYYWRVDSQNERGTIRGDVWRFTTESRPHPKPAKTTSPVPASNATDVSSKTSLQWAAATGATSYLVYFGTAPLLVKFQGEQSATRFDLDESLDYATRYCWRIDTKNDGGTTTGDVWCFTTEAKPIPKVTNPRPADNATNVGVQEDLTWSAAPGATIYVVYLGTTQTLGNTEMRGEQISTSFDAILKYNTTYYWRIDSKGNGRLTEGDVWSFTTVQAPTTGLVTAE